MRKLILLGVLALASPAFAGTAPCTTAVFTTGATVTSAYLNNCSWISESFVAEGTVNAHQTTLNFVDPVADVILQYPALTPAGTYTLATLEGTETFTNKTLTTPAITTASLTTPIVLGIADFDGSAVSDDDCTGQIGQMWFDDTDNAFEFCNADSGVPGTLAATSGDVTAVGDCTTAAAFTGACGTLLQSNTDLIEELDNDNNGTESWQVKDGADTVVAEITEAGALTVTAGMVAASVTTTAAASPELGFDDSVAAGTEAKIVGNATADNNGGLSFQVEEAAATYFAALAIASTAGAVVLEMGGVAGDNSWSISEAGAMTPAGTASIDLPANTVVDGDLATTDEECFPLYNPAGTILDTYDITTVWRAPVAITVTEVFCETDTGTVNLDLQIDDGTPADIMGADLVCDATGETDSSGLTGSMAAGDRIDFAITSVASSPTRVTACIVYTR